MGFPIRLLKYKLKKKSNKRYLVPFFLSSQDQEITVKLKDTIEFFENFVTQAPKREFFDKNEIINIFDDYKIGSCVYQTLGRYYEFQAPTFDEFESKASNFLKEGITTPNELRVFLFNKINSEESGFLSKRNKDAFLKKIADFFAVEIHTLEEFLWLDDENNQRLICTQDKPPTVEDIINTYNWNVIDTLVKNSLNVTFQVKDATGTFAKKIHWLCKRYGLFYDMNYEEQLILHARVYGVYDDYQQEYA
jgi:predicted nuclease of restriction endonuclease-like RecB superfamily